MSSLRREVLNTFKNLHRVSQKTFANHYEAITEARTKINQGYKLNMELKNEADIKVQIKLAKDVARELKVNVVQAVEESPGVYKAKITKDSNKLDNVLYKEDAIIMPPPRSKKCR